MIFSTGLRMVIITVIIFFTLFAILDQWLFSLGGDPFQHSWVHSVQLSSSSYPASKWPKLIHDTCKSTSRGVTTGGLEEPLPPKSPYKIHPKDIHYLITIGDSLSTGTVAKGNSLVVLPSLLGGFEFEISNFNENKDVSFISGARFGFNTFFNFLKFYNPNVQGGTMGNDRMMADAAREVIVDYYQASPVKLLDGGDLNVAFPFATADHVDKYEIPFLIKKWKQRKNTKSQRNLWKLANIFIGSNDLCQMCNGLKNDGPSYLTSLNSTISQLRHAFSNLIINVYAPVLNPNRIKLEEAGNPYCKRATFKNMAAHGHCTCLVSNTFDWERHALNMQRDLNSIRDWWKKWCERRNAERGVQVLGGGSAGWCDDFAIRSSTHQFSFSSGNDSEPVALRESFVPVDMISSADCFHWSTKAHGWVATRLWNELFGIKGDTLVPYRDQIAPYCPGPEDYLLIE